MKLQDHGTNTSIIEVTNIDGIGFWIFDGTKEYHLSFSDFPWFADAPVKAILNVIEESPRHLHWPTLDVDLTFDIIENPEAYPLKYS